VYENRHRVCFSLTHIQLNLLSLFRPEKSAQELQGNPQKALLVSRLLKTRHRVF
jgi:hypothetical protein